MLNIEVNRSAEGVERYFDRELAVSDYLMKEPGIWAGRGAKRLGLRGPVRRSQFVALLRNENPTTGKRLTARMNTSRQENRETVSNRQVGYGLVFGVPKSLSAQIMNLFGFGQLSSSPRRFSGSAVLAPASCSAWPCRLTVALQLTKAPSSADRCQSGRSRGLFHSQLDVYGSPGREPAPSSLALWSILLY